IDTVYRELLVPCRACCFRKSAHKARCMSLVVFLPIFPMFFILSKAPNQFDLSYFLIPFLNLHALFKQLLFGMVEPAAILYTSGTIAVLIAIFFLLARACFLKDKWVLPK
ncbi:hypothetical protein ACFTRA_15705, partial [Bacillus spizizenii]|uniref:hypothetical protein n=1 Tax=Bacillus spizizenii TaxID=96241 RepID=UPI00363AD636